MRRQMDLIPERVVRSASFVGRELCLHHAQPRDHFVEEHRRNSGRVVSAALATLPKPKRRPSQQTRHREENQTSNTKLHQPILACAPPTPSVDCAAVCGLCDAGYGVHTRPHSPHLASGVTLGAVLRVSSPVAAALADGRPVVALESTISSTLGLPVPFNAEVLDRCVAAIEAGGGTAAITAVIDGVARVGLEPREYERVLSATKKCAERDLPVAIAEGWDVGVTTVSATVALCAAAGVRVFATGGIGGVHRDDHLTGDVSADLGAIARHSVIVVTAGAKAFLDLPKTAELLDTLSVPVLGYGTDEFPAFYSRTSGIAIHRRIDDLAIAARVLSARVKLGLSGGVIVANPIPEAAEIAATEIAAAIEQALADAKQAGVVGAALTPFVLGRIADVTGGRSIPANLALAENNARVATEIASAVS